MKIGMLLDNDFKSDPRVLNEAVSLVRAGHEVHILCFTYGQLPRYEVNNGIHIHRTWIPKGVKDVLFILINRLPLYTLLWFVIGSIAIRRYGLQAIHAHDLYMAKPGWYLKRRFAVKFVLDLHENFPAAILAYKWIHKFPHRLFVNARSWEKQEFKLLNYPDYIITLSQSYSNYLLSKYPHLRASKFVEYPNVPDVETLQGFDKVIEFNDIPKGFWLFYFGIVSERRGLITVFEALLNELNKIQDIKLLIVGPIDKAELAKFKTYLQHPNLKARVVHFEWKNISELPMLIHTSSICISPIEKNPQHDSGIANKVFQYMLFEKPVLVSNCTPQEDLIKSTACGLVFESGSRKDFAEKTLELYQNDSLRVLMGVYGKKAILKTYNLVNYGKKISALYTD